MGKKSLISVLFLSLFFTGAINAQLHTTKPKTKPKSSKKKTEKPKLFSEEGKTNFQFGAGIMSSVVYLSRNVNEGNDARGWTVMANYGGGNRMIRVSLQYTKSFPINLAPTWYNVKWLVLFKNKKSILYPQVGLSYNTYKGYFTGSNDYLNLGSKYQRYSTVKNMWMGLNLGTGFEHSFGPVVFFFDYKMRIGKMEERGSITIMDVCYSGGLRLKLWVPNVKIKFNKIFRGIHDKYHWF
jgi:hypothetical protein